MATSVERLGEEARRERWLAQDGIAVSCGCVFCDIALQPVRLKRQWVHHVRGTGRLIMCNFRNLKPAAS